MADRKAQKKRRLELEAKIKAGQVGGAFPKSDEAWKAWLKKNTGTKLLKDGSRQQVWKTGESKGEAFDATKGKDLWRQDYYGTKTPMQDLKYLKQLDRDELKIDRLRSNKLRTAASQKDWEGKSLHQLEVDQLEEKLAKEAEELKVGSSYETPTDQLKVNPERKDYKIPGEFKGTQEEFEAKYGVSSEEVVPKKYDQNRANNLDNKVDNSETNYVDLAGGNNAFNDPANQTNGTSTRERLTAREKMRAQNVERFGGGEAGEWHVSKLEERNQAFQDAKGGGKEAMAEFRKDYGENLGSYLRNEKLKIDPKKKKKVNVNKSKVA